jgi:hypothetical protein
MEMHIFAVLVISAVFNTTKLISFPVLFFSSLILLLYIFIQQSIQKIVVSFDLNYS